jgi:hypothetical protein
MLAVSLVVRTFYCLCRGSFFYGTIDMSIAEVLFARNEDVVEMTLCIHGESVAASVSQEHIARELQMRRIRHIVIDGLFETDLPTSDRTVKAAAEVNFAEPLAALKLIAACASMGEVAAYSFPERRAKPRPSVDLGDTQQVGRARRAERDAG